MTSVSPPQRADDGLPPVVILCGGMGTRLREETEFRPKPMVMVGPRPILWHIMKHFAHYGHRRFVLCLGYKGEVIKDYFFRYHLMTGDVTVSLGAQPQFELHAGPPAEDWRVSLIDTGPATLKGGRLKRAAPWIEHDRFLVTYGDGVADVDVRQLLAFHRRHGRLATVTGVRPRSAFGELQAREGRVISFVEKPQIASSQINGGYFVFERAVLDRLTTDEDCDLESGLLDKLAAEGELMMYQHEGSWACMDTLRDASYLNQLWKSGKAFWRVWE